MTAIDVEYDRHLLRRWKFSRHGRRLMPQSLRMRLANLPGRGSLLSV